ncbi:hypothetical protein OM076_13770 [Solirubrobacter ginsenosidimutans]|uniref:Uncharacterized protein n=1 Tax=Solirubrobacter ginsenosidimutans TaxID=490573 RepID=A0A9X3S2N3_9ACTN|nr:hypothetical protein [Solirubrobacter ginsenosidimutans]MDA0161341.1 hypothetical protein [Solirubrobacter ginsenosidimutans]
MRYRDGVYVTAQFLTCDRTLVHARHKPEPAPSVEFPLVALHATTIRFGDRGYMAIARAADSQGISVSQYVREAALIRAVLDDLDYAEQAVHTAHDLLAVAREIRRLAEVDPPGPPRAGAGRKRSASAKDRQDS